MLRERGFKIATFVTVTDGPTTIDPVGLMLKEKEGCENVSIVDFKRMVKSSMLETRRMYDAYNFDVEKCISEERHYYEGARYIEVITGRPMVHPTTGRQIEAHTWVTEPDHYPHIPPPSSRHTDVCAFVDPLYGLEPSEIVPEWRRVYEATISASLGFIPKVTYIRKDRNIIRLAKEKRWTPTLTVMFYQTPHDVAWLREFVPEFRRIDVPARDHIREGSRDVEEYVRTCARGFEVSVSNNQAWSRDLEACAEEYASYIEPTALSFIQDRHATDIALAYARAKVLGCDLRVVTTVPQRTIPHVNHDLLETLFPVRTYLAALRARMPIPRIISQLSLIIENEMLLAPGVQYQWPQIAVNVQPLAIRGVESVYVRPASLGRQVYAGTQFTSYLETRIRVQSGVFNYSNVLPMLPCSFIAHMGGPQFGTFQAAGFACTDDDRQKWLNIRLEDFRNTTASAISGRLKKDAEACGIMGQLSSWLDATESAGMLPANSERTRTALHDTWAYAPNTDLLHLIDLETYIRTSRAKGEMPPIPDFVYVTLNIAPLGDTVPARLHERSRVIYGVVFLNVLRMKEWIKLFDPDVMDPVLPAYMHEVPIGAMPLRSFFLIPRHMYSSGLSSSVVAAHRTRAAHRTVEDLLENMKRKQLGKPVGSGHMIAAQLASTAYLMYYLYEVCINHITKRSLYSLETEEQVEGGYHSIAEYMQGLEEIAKDYKLSARNGAPYVEDHVYISRRVIEWLGSIPEGRQSHA